MRNVGYSVINTARSALSTFITIDNHTVGIHPLVCRYLKGVFNEFPVLRKYSFTWDVGVVLKYISFFCFFFDTSIYKDSQFNNTKTKILKYKYKTRLKP